MLKIIAPQHRLGAGDATAAAAESELQIPAHAHCAVKAAVFLEACVVDEGRHLIHCTAQDADHVRGTGLIGFDVLGLDAGTAHIVTAGCGDAKGLLQLHAAVIHQNAQKLRRCKRHAFCIQNLIQALQLQASGQALMRGSVDRGRGLEVVLHKLRTEGRLKQRADLLISPYRNPLSVLVPGLNLPPVFVMDRERVILRPILVIASAEVYVINFIV